MIKRLRKAWEAYKRRVEEADRKRLEKYWSQDEYD